MNNFKALCVFCGSKEGNSSEIVKAAELLGSVLVKKQITLVYGAAKIGIMGIIADTVLKANGNVIGVIPEFLKVKEVVHTELTELYVTETMHERKMKMQKLSDGFIALPGGYGTLEEVFEIITWLQLGLHQKPIGVLNTDNYYDPLVKMVETMVQKGFLSKANASLLIVDETVEGLLDKMNSFKPDVAPKWMQSSQS